jgi:coproporphyrinogen III oxidase-like Fe-S oxidoreductase
MPTPPKMRQDGVGLYIHFPFCRAKCPYCHFDSVPYSDAGADLWLERLELEVRLFAHRGMAVETIY